MKIKEVTKVEGGYNVSFVDADMVAFVYKQEEINGLKKDGWIKTPKPIKKKNETMY